MLTRILIFFVVYSSCLLRCHGQVPPRYEVFIYSFAKNLQWPIDHGASEFVIGIYENKILQDEMEAFVSSKPMIGARKIVIKAISKITDVGSCHILFLPKGQSTSLNEIVRMIKDIPVLLIGEAEDLAKQGCDISFVTEDGRFRFQFNLHSIESRGIKMPGNLKSLGIQVDGVAKAK
jgi:hypothetical protein